jgi:hypothetical protein
MVSRECRLMQDTGIPGKQISSGASMAGPPPETVGNQQMVAATSLPPAEVRYTGFDLWMHRLTMLLLVFVCAIVGVLLLILPWRPEWTDNHLLLNSPALRGFVASGFVRGVCSGLGLLDIWIGFWEAIHYHEFKHR